MFSNVLGISTDPAKEYCFLKDNGSNSWGVSEARQSLIFRGCIPKAATEQWAQNHYRWIVWICISYARCLLSKWEGNASSQQLEVLYLASIYSNGDSFRIEVIDRWYDINSAVDAILVQIIRNGGLCVGDKISCAGPHANGLSEGALPLFDTAKSALLSLTGNSVRRDRWHTKLGFQPKRMMYMSLSAVHELGGPIGAALDVTILRSYAMLYVETMATDQRV
ncbi:hypothetical protein GGI26_001699, partial [Coemansia sp. RSA 1358]